MIKVEHLTKVYQRVKRKEGFLGGVRTLFSTEYEKTCAVDDISFEIQEGELVGYIGPNVVPWLGYFSPIVAITLVVLTSIVWHFAMRRYSSSGG